ncbi:MAG TPA: isoprenylcysteine carboxylmethyltransferase family protein [Methylocella sp.]|nr:isoprenylcysteine carboxylmethyltransferase family protein [Methylocella sp.]
MQETAPAGPLALPLPPLLLAAAIMVGVLLNVLWPQALLETWLRLTLGILMISAALAIGFLAVRVMRAVNTPLDVRKAPTEVVTTGVFAISRNPVYLAMVLLCGGIAFLANTIWLLLAAAALAVILHTQVIDKEEAYLKEKFGEAYSSYKSRVRRWI